MVLPFERTFGLEPPRRCTVELGTAISRSFWVSTHLHVCYAACLPAAGVPCFCAPVESVRAQTVRPDAKGARRLSRVAPACELAARAPPRDEALALRCDYIRLSRGFSPRPVEHARAHTEKATVGAVAFRVSDANEYAAGQVEPAAGAYQNVFFTAPGPLPLRYHCGPLVGHVARVKLVCCAGVCNLFPSASMAWKRSRVRISPGPPNSSSTKFVVTVSGVVVNWKSPRDAGLPAKPNASRQAVCSPPSRMLPAEA